jgi:hypothetical protein
MQLASLAADMRFLVIRIDDRRGTCRIAGDRKLARWMVEAYRDG